MILEHQKLKEFILCKDAKVVGLTFD